MRIDESSSLNKEKKEHPWLQVVIKELDWSRTVVCDKLEKKTT